jgi:hypothetical protein
MAYLPLAGQYKYIQLILYLHSVVSLGGTMLGVYENGKTTKKLENYTGFNTDSNVSQRYETGNV